MVATLCLRRIPFGRDASASVISTATMAATTVSYTASALLPKGRSVPNWCLGQRKKSSICQRFLYDRMCEGFRFVLGPCMRTLP